MRNADSFDHFEPTRCSAPACRIERLRRKSLFVSPVGGEAKERVRRIVERFGHDEFDFRLLVYDDSRYVEHCFARCTVIQDRTPLFWQLKRQVPPVLARRYEYVFLWVDDLDVLEFNPQHFLQILRRHRLEVAQPALTPDSVISHPITGRHEAPIGRYTDFVEEMAFVFRGDRWERFWRLIAPDRNPWGWGYDELAYSVCGFRRMAIIDAEVIRHLRQGVYHDRARAGQSEVHRRYERFYFPKKQALCPISDRFLRRYLATPLRLNLHFLYAGLYTLLGLAYLRPFLRACFHFPTRQTGVAT
jgi:hypothetical protein